MGAEHSGRPRFVVEDGRPVAVIIGIDEYRSILERLDDADDVAYLREAAGRKLEFRELADYLLENEDS